MYLVSVFLSECSVTRESSKQILMKLRMLLDIVPRSTRHHGPEKGAPKWATFSIKNSTQCNQI